MRLPSPRFRIPRILRFSRAVTLREFVARGVVVLLIAPLIAALFTFNNSADASVGDSTGPKIASSTSGVWNNVYTSSDTPLNSSNFPAGVRITVRVTNGFVRLSTTVPSGDSAITANSQSGVITDSTGATEMDWWAQSAATGNQALRTLQVRASSSSSSPSVVLAASPAAVRPSTANPDGQAQSGAAFANFPNPVYVTESDSWFELVNRNSTNWATARTEAGNRSLNNVPARLASLESGEQSRTVRALLKGTNQQVYLGASDIATENIWVWTDGNAWSWTTRPTTASTGRNIMGEWQNGEPNSDTQDCLQIDWSWSSSGYWDDIQCDYLANFYVAEYGGQGSGSTTYLPTLTSTRTISFSNDSTAPTVTSFSSTQSSPTNATTFTYTLQFSESVTGVASGDFSNTGTASSCNFNPGTDSGSSRTVTVSGCGEGTVIPRFAANGATDLAGNVGPSSAATASTTITRDVTGPTMNITSSSATVASGATATITFTSNKSTTTFDQTDVSVTLGTLTNFSSTNSTTYTATFTGSRSSGGTATISVDAGKFTDSVGNGNTVSNSRSITVTNTTSSTGGRTSYVGNGTIGDNGTKYVVERFTTTGTPNWRVPNGVTSIDYLVIGGGGAGGTRHGGGGGAGGLRSSVASTGGGSSPESRMTVTPGALMTVTVGAGGTNGSTAVGSGTNGSNSVLGSLTATGGGAQAATGGSGGGSNANYAGGSGTANQGFTGGAGGGNDGNSNWWYAGGGGGGAGGVGSDKRASAVGVSGGPGGSGVINSITGVATCYAGGGAGGYSNDATNVGTIEGGKCGSTMVGGTSPRGANATSGAVNTGSGGGGGGFDGGAGNYAGGNGGSGLVVVRYALPSVSTPDLADASDSATNNDDITSARTLTFTGSAPVGASVQLSVATATSTSDTDTTTGTWTNTGSACTADSTTGAWSCITAELAPGLHKFRSTATTILDGVTDIQTSTSALVVTIDTTVPTVTGVAYTSDAGTDNTYKTGDVVSISVTFSETVTVTGTPRIPILGLTSKFANYSSGSGTNTLVFTYTVALLDTDSDGLAITASTLALNSGTIKDVPGNNAALTHDAVAAQSAHKVDTTAPTVTSVAFTSNAGTDNTYKADDIVSVSVAFSETVTVTGFPQIPIAGLSSKFTTYSSGSGTNTLVFTYTVVSGDTDTDGLAIALNTLALNSGTITDVPGNNATLTHAAVAAQSAHKVDTTAPTVTSVDSSTLNGFYKSGDVIAIQVSFSEVVSVNTSGGIPSLTLETGTIDTSAPYASGSGSTTLVFNYTVQPGDTSSDLTYVSTNSIALNSGSITDVPGTNANLTLASPTAANSLGANKAFVIDGVTPSAPRITSAVETGTTITVNFNAPASNAASVTGYQVQTSIDGNTWTTSSNSVAANAISHRITGLTPGTAYYVRVAAKYGASIGPYGYRFEKIYEVVSPNRSGSAIQYATGFGLGTNDAKSAHASTPFTRVRYRMATNYRGGNSYVDADFNRTFEYKSTASLNLDSIDRVQVPTTNSTAKVFHGGVNDLTVESNVPEVKNGSGLVGRLEIWPFDYGAGTTFSRSGVCGGADGSDSTYDYNDLPGTTGTHGSFQLHQISTTASECGTIFAWNDHAPDRTPAIGYGSRPTSHPDWTHAANYGSTHTNFNLQIYVDVPVTTGPRPTASIAPAVTTVTAGSSTTATITLSTASTDFTVDDLDATLGSLSNFSGSGTTYTVTYTPFKTSGGTDTITIASESFSDAEGSTNTSAQTQTISVSNTYSSTGGRTSYVGNGNNGVNGTRYIVENFTATGSSTWTAPRGVTSVEYLVVAGGGGGGGSTKSAHGGGGGGAGGYRTNAISVTPGADYTVIVGGGGNGGGRGLRGSSGGSSQFGSITATGGGGGGAYFSAPTSGGSGGGAGASDTLVGRTGANGNSGEGFKGGNTPTAAYTSNGAGGGGSGGAGTNGVDDGPVAIGGIGTSSSITGSSITRAIGGSGGIGTNSTAGTTASSNTGNGGGGASAVNNIDSTGGAGGSGLVVVRYQLPAITTPELTAASDSATEDDNITSTRTLTFTGSAPVGASVQLSVATASSTSDTDTTTGTWTNTGSSCEADPTTGEWECTADELEPGLYKIRSTSTTILDGVTDTQTSVSALVVTIDTTIPTLSGIALSSDAGTDNTYKTGDVVSVTATFSEKVVVTGIPRIAIQVGSSLKYANYASGSGTTSLVFTYTVSSGDTDLDGIAIAADSFELNSGTITDLAGNAANDYSHTAVTAQSSHKVDTTSPTVTNVTSSTSDSSVGIGATVSIQVKFSEAVTVTGTPQLTLETGTTDRTANFTSGSGTDTLTFVYTVQSGDTATDLDYVSSTSLALNGGSISDNAGNGATLTLPAPGATGSLGANKNIVVASEPTQIVSVREPVGTASGATFTTQPRVSLQDNGGSVVTSDNTTEVTATVSTGATLVGTRTATAVNGIVTFSNLGISGTSGTAYTITYSATVNGNSLTVATQSVTPTVGAAVRISITRQPVGDTAGALLSTQPVVKVLDSGDNVVTGSSIAVTVSASGGTLGGTKVVNAASGVATFSDLTFAGTASTNYTLTFTTTSLGSATSNNFSVGVGVATKLVLTTNASGAVYGEAFTTQPVVELRDAGNNKVTTGTNVVTATLSSGTVSGTTDTSVTATAVGGVATFSGFGITGTPGNFTITYSSGTLATDSQTITLIKADQTITFADPADRTWSATAFSLSPTSTSDLTVTVTSTTTDICTVSGLDVTMVKVGTCSLTASQAGNDFYNAATSASQSFEISQASQSISFAAITDRSWSANTFDVAPTATSGLTVTLTTDTAEVCTVSGMTVSMLKAGTCGLTASQSGSTNYSAAISVTKSFEISLATQATLSIATLTATYEDDLTLATLGGSGDGAMTYTKVSGDCTLSNGVITPTAAGACVVTASKAADTQYASASVTSTITINKANQSVSLTLATTSVVYGQTLTLSGSGGEGDGAITYSVSEGTCTLSSAVLTPDDAGSVCKVSITRAESANYNSLTSDPIVITVRRATPTLGTLALSTKTFGDAAFTLTGPSATYDNASVAGAWSYSSAQTSVSTIDGSTATITGGGTSVITATFSPADSVNYNSANTSSTLTVNKATPTFSWSNVSATYGDADFAIVSPTVATTAAIGTWSYVSATTSVVTISSTKFDVGNAGSSVITATFTPSNTTNYVSGGTITMTVTVERADQATLSISSISGTYGTDLTLTTTGGTTSGTITWGVSNDSATGCAISSGKLATTSIGTCTVTATMAGNDNYNSVTNSGTTVTISAKPISVTAEAKTKVYGDNDPALTYTTITGALVGNDTLSGSLERAEGENVGDYTINQGTVANSNYDITYVSAKLTITQKPITVTAEAKTKVYGNNDPALTYTTGVGDLLEGDSLSGSLERAEGNTVGEYSINQGTVANTNYNITFTTAKLTITQKPIAISADTQTKIYGQDEPDLTFTIPAGSLVGNDQLTGTPTRVAGENVGEYTINKGTVANTNYDITFTTAKLTITQKPITVTAEAKTKTFGDSDPVLTYTTPVGALVGSDKFTGSLTRDAGEDTSVYTIKQGTVDNSNYNITFVTSTLTIVQAPQSALSVTTANITYRTAVVLGASGGSEGALSFAVATAGTASCSIDGLTLSATGDAGSTCTVTATRAETRNYLQKTSAAFTITVVPRLITLTGEASDKTYGDADPGFTFRVTTGSLFGSDTISGTQTRDAGENVGTYTINKGSLANPNYTITYVSALFTINQRPITISATNKTKIFGDADPGLTYTVTSGNVVNSDTFTGAITRAPGETLGTYNITRGTLANGNYNITFVVGTLRITGAQQQGFVLTASSYSVVYQDTVTLTTTGGNGEGLVTFTAQDGTGSCSIAADVLTGETAGTCTVTAVKAAEGGYLEATSNVITITVDKAEQTITLAQMVDHDFTLTPMAVTPTTDSGLQVVLESRTPNVCTLESFEVHLKDSGTCTLAASVPESRNHNAAPTVTRSFTVNAVVPFAPTITEVTPGNATISVDFVAGLSGGASITTYKYSVNDGATWTQWPDGSITSPLVITNVPNSIESKVRIAAVNRVGTGARSNMKAATPKSPVWEVERKSNTAFSTSAEPLVSAMTNQLPPRPALVRTKSVLGGRRTQVTATRASKDVNIPVTHAIISVRLKNGRLLTRIQVRVDPTNPTTTVTVPYKSSLVRISVQFANDIGISAGGTAGANLREGTTFLGTTINGRPRLAGTTVPGSVRFAKGSSTLTSTAKSVLRKSLKTAQARGGLIYVTGYANSGETKSSWMLETLARKRAENVSKYLISIGARQWITFYGAPTAPTTWHASRAGHVDIATVGLDQI